MTDKDQIFKLTKWELDAVLEGLHYRQVDERENLVELALNLRYTLNAKKVNSNKLNLKGQRRKIKDAFRSLSTSESQKQSNDRLSAIERLNNHFRNR